MLGRMVLLVVALELGAVAKGEVLVELVPDNPGPYTGGESLTVDVWLHSQVGFDAFLFDVQLAFSDSDPALSLDPTFTFDLSAIPNDVAKYATVPELPVPVVGVVHDGPLFPEIMLPLPAGGSLHIGSIAVQLSIDPGVYRLDALNADEPDELRGALIDALFFPGNVRWRAFTGEITGGTFDLVVSGPPIPTVSEWGIIAMGLLLLVLGTLMIIRRTRGAKDASSFRGQGTGRGSVCNGALRSRAPLFALICAGGVLLGSSNDARGQAPLVPVETIQIGVDSGIVADCATR